MLDVFMMNAVGIHVFLEYSCEQRNNCAAAAAAAAAVLHRINSLFKTV